MSRVHDNDMKHGLTMHEGSGARRPAGQCQGPIDVIYGSTMGTGTPAFWTVVLVSPTFQDIGEEFAVIRGNLRRLNYTKRFRLRPGPCQRVHVLPRYQRAPCSPLLNWSPTF